MGLHKLSAGDGYTYLTRQVAAHDRTEGVGGLADYYADSGESPGRWAGSGIAGLDLAPGQDVTEEQMKLLFGQGRHPDAARIKAALLAGGATSARAETATALGRAFPVYTAGRPLRVAWAAAFSEFNLARGARWDDPLPPDERQRIRTQVATLAFTDQHGRGPLDERELAGYIARESRPATTAVAGYDLTFSPVKSVSTLWAVAPLEVARTIEEAHHAAVADTLAWLEREAAFTRVGRAGIRQVETRGLVATAFTHRDTRCADPDLHTHLAIANRVQEKTTGQWYSLDGRMLYQANVAASERYNTRLEAELTDRLGLRFAERADPSGRRPVREVIGVDATLSQHWSQRRTAIQRRYAELAASFQRRHGRPPTPVEAISLRQHATLDTREAKHQPRSEATQRRGWAVEAATVLGGDRGVRAMVHNALTARLATTHGAGSERWIHATSVEIVRVLESSRASWQMWHVHAEAQRQARGAAIPRPRLDETVERLVAHTLGECSIPLTNPDEITEPTALRRSTGHSVYDVHAATAYTSRAVLDAEEWLLEAAGRDDGRHLHSTQCQPQHADPAAAGEVRLSDAQQAMVRELTQSPGRVKVALAPAGTGKTTALRAVVRAWTQSGGSVLGVAPSAQAAHELGSATGTRADTLSKLTWSLKSLPPEQWPSWIADIDAATLLLVDEAGQAGTVELREAVEFVMGRGGSVRLIGDDQQLAAVGAGGILTDLVRAHGAATLTEVRRFDDPAEAAATLALRDGDATALGYYADHRRIHVGDLDTVLDHAFTSWVADRVAGRDSLLLAPTREMATRLNERARAHRLESRQSPVDPASASASDAGGREPEVTLVDGTAASVGDLVVTRRNDRRLRCSTHDWVRNGDRWTVAGVHPDHSITVQRTNGPRSSPRTRPPTVTLPPGYVHDHVRLGYASTVHAAQGMTVDTAHAVVSGDETRQLLYVAMTRGRRSNHVYVAAPFDGNPHGLIDHEATHPRTAIEALARILTTDGAPQSATSIRDHAHAPTTRLHNAVLRYCDALSLLAPDHDATPAAPGLTEAPHTQGPLPWLPPVPHARPDHRYKGHTELHGARGHRFYLHQRASQIEHLANAVRATTRLWTSHDAPTWAQPLLRSGQRELLEDLAVWRAAFDIPDTDTRPTGPGRAGGIGSDHQRHLRGRLPEARRPSTSGGVSLPDAVTDDAHSPRLIRRLDDLARGGIAVQHLIDVALDTDRPLPTEAAADALWWRIAPHLGPATLRAAEAHRRALRPDWADALENLLGSTTYLTLVSDPAWPALVAAVNHADDMWTPTLLLSTAVGGLPGSQTNAVDPELCEHLLWRVAMLTDPVPRDADADADTAMPALARGLRSERRGDGGSGEESTRVGTGDRGTTTRERILELNREAWDYYTQQFPRSWAPRYLEQRLGVPLPAQSEDSVGYAPPGPRSLIRHLTAHGVREQELVDAGLAKRSDRGTIDAFRDRMMFAIHHDGDPVGFIGRRNPTKDDSEHGGPKYLNSRTTAVFTKGHHIYGLSEAQVALESGAHLVLVEGPLDAIAVTLVGGGEMVGVAPLGTAFTPAQADLLRTYATASPHGICVATDGDAAGRAAAHRAYWPLSAIGAAPRFTALPEGCDPADLYRQGRHQELRDLLRQGPPLAVDLIARAVDEPTSRRPSLAHRGRLTESLGRIIATAPPATWPSLIGTASALSHLAPAVLEREVAYRCQDWPEIQPLADAPAVTRTTETRSRRLTPEGPVETPTTDQPRLRSRSPGRQPEGRPF